jgi:apolipoprotein N-acyltransferase
LTVSDDRERILAEVPSNSAPFAALMVNVPSAHSWTVFQLLGDWFAWNAILLVIFTWMQIWRVRGPHRGVNSKALMD